MAISTDLNLVLTFCIPTVLFLLFIRSWLKKERYQPSLPPGPFGLPLLGNLPFLSPDLHRCFADLSRTYGPVMTVRLGCKLCVVLSSSSVAREALKDNDLTFASHDVPAAALAARLQSTNLVWHPYGPVWRMLRKISVRELLSASNLEAVQPIRRREVRRMVQTIRAKEGSAVEVREVVFLTSLSVIVGMIWGGTVDDEGEGKEFMEVMDGIVEYLGKANVSDFFPVLAPLDIQGIARQLVRFRDCYFRIFDSIFEDRRKMMDANEGGRDRQRDFLQVMLELMDKGGDSQVPLKIDHVKDVFLDLVGGGTDTASTTVEWAITEILNNHDIMKKVQEELDEVVGKNRFVEESDIPSLHYLNAVVKEVFRLHPVVPLLIPYSPSSSCTVGGFSIPKGTKVFINVWAIHRDPSVWKDPLKFEPERFFSRNDKYDYSGNNFNYLPFGSGRRICPGISLGVKMVTYLLASLLYSFEWRLPKGTKMNLDENFGIVLKKEKPLVAIPSSRLS